LKTVRGTRCPGFNWRREIQVEMHGAARTPRGNARAAIASKLDAYRRKCALVRF